ncbi:ABC transporter substrate-binding protein [Streptomyces sp. NPDC087270]|uniref:ABC transporter substrate-binding protein n=1 Tax=Streptomyces sp. NPDC087270 TaxID=3365774 RepID=UPI0038208A4F
MSIPAPRRAVRRLLRPAALLTAVVALVAGCAHGSVTRTTTGDGRRIVHYMTFTASPDHLEDLARLAKSFERSHPGIDVQVQSAPFDQYFTQLQTSAAGGTAPDVFELNQDEFASFADSGALADLDSRVRADAVAGHFSASSLAGFRYDGRQYGLPSSFSTELLFYNKKLFDAAGVAYPTADWTWQDEQRAARKIAALGHGVFGDYQNTTYLEFTKALAQNGGSFLSEDGTRVAFDSPQGIAAARWLTGKVGSTMPTQAQMGGSTDYDTRLFEEGKLGIWHSGSWFFPNLAAVHGLSWDVVQEPAASTATPAESVFQNSLAMSSQSKNADAAWQWMRYLTTSQEVAKLRIDTSWELSPATGASLRKSYLAQTPPTNRAAVFEALKHVAPSPQLLHQAQIADIVTNELQAVTTGSATVEKALATAARQVQPLLSHDD